VQGMEGVCLSAKWLELLQGFVADTVDLLVCSSVAVRRAHALPKHVGVECMLRGVVLECS
jgi:hypothetical protein